MILFDWHKVFQYAGGNASVIMNIMSHITFPHLPNNRYDKIYNLKQEDWSGSSFLVNPEKVITHRRKYHDSELAEYVALASFRSLADFQATNNRRLLLELAPVSVTKIENNRLLTITHGQIVFNWEEVTH